MDMGAMSCPARVQDGKDGSCEGDKHIDWLETRKGKEPGGLNEYLRVEDIAGNSAENEQPVLLHGPGHPQSGHPLQGALVSLVMVAQPSAFFFRELF